MTDPVALRYGNEIPEISTAVGEPGSLWDTSDVVDGGGPGDSRGEVMVVSSTTTDLVKIGTHLDVRNVGLVRTTVHRAIDSATGDVVVDMGGVELVDAAGLGMLTAAHLRAERAGHRMVLRHCSDDVRRLLAVTHLNRVLHIDRAGLHVAAQPQLTA